MDVTDPVGREERLRRSEALLQFSQRMAHVGSWYVDDASGVVEWSDEMFRIHGLEPPVPSTESAFWDLVHPEDADDVRARLAAAVRDGGDSSLAYRIVRPNGEVRHLHGVVRAVRDGGATRIFGTAQDVTERMRAENAKTFLVGLGDVLASSLNPRALLDAALAHSVPELADIAVVTLFHGGLVERRVAVSPAAEGKRALVERLAGSSQPKAWIASAIQRGEPVLIEKIDDTGIEAVACTPEDADAMREIGLRSLLAVPLLRGAHPIGVVTLLVTESSRAYDATDVELARELSTRVALAFDNARLYDEARRRSLELEEAQRIGRVGSWTWSMAAGNGQRGRSSVSAEVVRALGLDPMSEDPLADIVGRALGEDGPRLREDIRAVLSERRTSAEGEYRFVCAEGEARVFHVRTELEYDDRRRCVRATGALHDVTQQRELEARLRQSQKMEAVGRLAGGVAHDFNNLLTVISASTEFMLEDTAAGDPRREDLLVVHEAAQRAAALTQRLLTFSRSQMLRPRLVDLRHVVEGATTMLRRLVGEDVSLHVSTGHEPLRVIADPGSLEQVLVNLVVNGRDALPEGGRIDVSTSAWLIDQDAAARHPGLEPGLCARISVTDDGVGMDDRTRARVFEPFFTTKEAGKGTGLGLATVFGLVEQARGHIGVESSPAGGTTFTILLPIPPPAAQGESTRPAPVPVPRASASRGRETVLVIEDDDDVRRIARRALEHGGYLVLEAGSAGEALAVADRFEGSIDLVLSDVVLPDSSGRVAVEALERTHPDIAVLFMSGYPADALVRHRIAERRGPFLEKPFTVDRLTAVVRAALDARGDRWSPPAPEAS